MQFSEKSRAILGVTLLSVAFFVGGIYIGYNDRPSVDKVMGIKNKTDDHITADFEPFWKTWQLLNEKSIKASTVTDQDKVYGAIKGLTDSFGDTYTEFFNPKESKQFNEAITGEFSGVGLEVGIKNNILTVISPIKGSPAANAGIKAGDMVLKIDSISTTNMTVDDAVQKIRGQAGTTVTLLVLSSGENSIDKAREVKIVRDVIVVPSLETKIDGANFVITMATFTGNNINPDIEKAMKEFKASGKKNLIIDLRGNPGGYLDSAIYMASFLLPANDIVVTEDYGKKQDSVVHKSQGFPLIDNTKTKVAILIDTGSASASEILAGALSDNSRAILVGEKSFGKGSVQEIMQVTDDTLLKVTVAHWLTPKGTSIQDNGITPENLVSLPKNWKLGDKDPQMEKAKELLAK